MPIRVLLVDDEPDLAEMAAQFVRREGDALETHAETNPADALDRLEAFTSLNGAAFYGMAPNEGRITLTRRDTPADYPASITAGTETVTVFDPGFPLYWHLED